jgi:IS1 family transposase
MNNLPLKDRLADMTDRTNRNNYVIGDYWNVLEEALERIEELERKYSEECDASMMAGSQNSALRLQLRDAEERASRFAKSADFLSQALNEGDGSYKP